MSVGNDWGIAIAVAVAIVVVIIVVRFHRWLWQLSMLHFMGNRWDLAVPHRWHRWDLFRKKQWKVISGLWIQKRSVDYRYRANALNCNNQELLLIGTTDWNKTYLVTAESGLHTASAFPFGIRATLGVLHGVDGVGRVSLHQPQLGGRRFGRIAELFLQTKPYFRFGLLRCFFL